MSNSQKIAEQVSNTTPTAPIMEISATLYLLLGLLCCEKSKRHLIGSSEDATSFPRMPVILKCPSFEAGAWFNFWGRYVYPPATFWAFARIRSWNRQGSGETAENSTREVALFHTVSWRAILFWRFAHCMEGEVDGLHGAACSTVYQKIAEYASRPKIITLFYDSQTVETIVLRQENGDDLSVPQYNK